MNRKLLGSEFGNGEKFRVKTQKPQNVSSHNSLDQKKTNDFDFSELWEFDFFIRICFLNQLDYKSIFKILRMGYLFFPN
jgi:hypothetical protein